MTSENLSDRSNPMGDYLLNDEIGKGGFIKLIKAIPIPTNDKVAYKNDGQRQRRGIIWLYYK